MPVPGGTGDARAPSAEEVELVKGLKSQIESRLGKPVDIFEPVLIRSQVVAGTNYFAKVRIDTEVFVHVRVFKPLPHVNEAVQVHGMLTAKSADDELAYFDAN